MVKRALVKDGWTVTHDPFVIEYGIAHDLLEAGIPKEDIVMASYYPTPQPLTELTAA